MGWQPQTPMSNGKEKLKLGLLRFFAASICLEFNCHNTLRKAVTLIFLEFFSHLICCFIQRVIYGIFAAGLRIWSYFLLDSISAQVHIILLLSTVISVSDQE